MTAVSFIVMDGGNYSFPSGAAEAPKGAVAVIQMDYVRALAVVNGVLSLETANCEPNQERLQEVFDKIGGGKKQAVSNWRLILCDEFDGESEESVSEMEHNVNALKSLNLELPFASSAHAKECSNCLVGVVTADGLHRHRFVPRRFDAYNNGAKMELMEEGETYDCIQHPTDEEPHPGRGTVVDFVHCEGDEYSVPNGAALPPKGPVPVIQLDYVFALAVVNGFVNLEFLGSVPEHKLLQKLYDTKHGGAGKTQTVSHWCMILCDEFDDECEYAVARMKHNIDGLTDGKLGLPFASVSHAKLCSNCLLGVVTVDGNYHMRFVPRRFETYGTGGKMELMGDTETYDGKPHPANEAPIPKVNELMRFCREVGTTAAVGVMKHPYPAAMALVSGKASIRNFVGGDVPESELQKGLSVLGHGTSFEKLPVAQWKLIVSEPIGESMTKEQLEVVCEVFKLVHGMASLSIAEAESLADCVVGAVHSDGRQIRKFKVPQPFSELHEFAKMLPTM